MKNQLTLATSLLCALAATTVTASANSENSLADNPSKDDFVSAIQAGSPILEVRPRLETVEQTGANDAEALTVRTRLGWKTGAWHGITATIEFEDVRELGGDYNNAVAPTEPFATIADPETTELNRAQISWQLAPQVSATIGRQRIAFDDQRFVGAVGWRQDDQTFDAARLDYSQGGLKATYAYIDHVNRIFAEAKDWGAQAHLVNVNYKFAAPLSLTGFAYLIDIDNPAGAAGQSSATYGVRASGKVETSPIQWAYALTYATQEDYRSNPGTFNLDYLGAELSGTYGIFSSRVKYENLEGNGTRGFSTPFATLHAMQGWADTFLATPAGGITDLNFSGTIRPPVDLPFLSKLALTIRHHSFESEQSGADLGNELDFVASAALTKRLKALIKYADYDGPGLPADRSKTWIGLDFKL